MIMIYYNIICSVVGIEGSHDPMKPIHILVSLYYYTCIQVCLFLHYTNILTKNISHIFYSIRFLKNVAVEKYSFAVIFKFIILKYIT